MKNVKTYENFKKLIGGSKLALAGIAGAGTLTFAACTTEEVTVSPASEVVVETTETPSQIEIIETSEPVEEVSEVVEVEDNKYSAEAITKIGDELSAEWPHFSRDQIDAIIIAINLDHISDEDLNTLLNDNGYTLESLNKSYIDGLIYLATLYGNNSAYVNGETYDQQLYELHFNEKKDFARMLLNDEYKVAYEECSNNYYDSKEGVNFNELSKYIDFENVTPEDYNSEIKVLYDLTLLARVSAPEKVNYNEVTINPYQDKINAKELIK